MSKLDYLAAFQKYFDSISIFAAYCDTYICNPIVTHAYELMLSCSLLSSLLLCKDMIDVGFTIRTLLARRDELMLLPNIW